MPTAHLLLLALIPIAYVIGSIPFGLLVGMAKGIDVRQAGSGNIGATNVGRLLGKRFFLLVFFLDLLKGLLPMLAAAIILGAETEVAHDWRTYLLWLLCGFAAIVGHMFSLFLKFKGGKGVATSAGVILGLYPYYTYPGLVAIGVWIVLFTATRYVSVASIFGAVLFPVTYVWMAWKYGWPMAGEQLPLLIFAILVAGMIVVKHRGNIARLRAGTENRFEGKTQP